MTFEEFKELPPCEQRDYLLTARDKRHLTRTAVAEKLGCGRTTLIAYCQRNRIDIEFPVENRRTPPPKQIATSVTATGRFREAMDELHRQFDKDLRCCDVELTLSYTAADKAKAGARLLRIREQAEAALKSNDRQQMLEALESLLDLEPLRFSPMLFKKF